MKYNMNSNSLCLINCATHFEIINCLKPTTILFLKFNNLLIGCNLDISLDELNYLIITRVKLALKLRETSFGRSTLFEMETEKDVGSHPTSMTRH